MPLDGRKAIMAGVHICSRLRKDMPVHVFVLIMPSYSRDKRFVISYHLFVRFRLKNDVVGLFRTAAGEK